SRGGGNRGPPPAPRGDARRRGGGGGGRPAVRCRPSRRSIGGARFFVRSATTADSGGDGDAKPRAQIGEIGGEVPRRPVPDPGLNPTDAQLVEVLEARQGLPAEGGAVVGGGDTLFAVTRAVQEETGATPSRHARDPPSQAEQERDLLASVQRALGVVPAVPGQRRGDAESPPQLVGKPEGDWPGQVEDPERVAD